MTDADMKPIMALFESKKSAGFEAGIEQGLRLILANPKFLFRTEAMRYVGAVIGLSIGYVAKYRLDKRFVFINGATPPCKE